MYNITCKFIYIIPCAIGIYWWQETFIQQVNRSLGLLVCVLGFGTFLGAFAKLREITIGFMSFCSSIRLSARLSVWNNSTPAGRIFTKFEVRGFFSKFCRENSSLTIKQISQIYFWNKILHVSGSSSVHYQEFFTVNTATVNVNKPVWYLPLQCVQWKTPDGGQRNCPKHAEFYSKNKFEKLVHLVGFIIRISHDARSPDRQKFKCHYIPPKMTGTLHEELCTFMIISAEFFSE